MATGREGLGQPRIPDFIHPIPRHFWAHTADDIDFAALRNKRVIVIGGSASAMDNAAEALEHGCAELRLLIRRNDLPRINKLTGIGSAGFTHGYRETTEAWQWRTMLYSEETGPPAPRNSTLRVSRHPNAHFHLGSAIETIAADADHITVRTSRGKNFAADFIILATGFTVDAASRPEIAAFADAIATWSDRYTPPPELANAELGAFPYLGPHLQFTEKHAGEAPFLAEHPLLQPRRQSEHRQGRRRHPRHQHRCRLARRRHRGRVLQPRHRSPLADPAGLRQTGVVR